MRKFKINIVTFFDKQSDKEKEENNMENQQSCLCFNDL